MKKFFSLLLIAALMLAFCACGAEPPPPLTPDDDKTTTTTTTTTITTTTTTPDPGPNGQPEPADDIFEYRGITFPGEYRMNQGKKEAFTLDLDLLEAEGEGLYQVSREAVLAYIAADFEGLSKFFEDDEKAQRGIFYIDEQQDKLGSMTDLALISAVYSIVVDDGCFTLAYKVAFDDDESAVISAEMYLNADNDWNVLYIGYYR